jgi:hypothetical protein
MVQTTQPTSEYQRRLNLLETLGWKQGQPLSEAVRGVYLWHFGMMNGKPFPGKTPLMIPSHKLATFAAHYAKTT